MWRLCDMASCLALRLIVLVAARSVSSCCVRPQLAEPMEFKPSNEYALQTRGNMAFDIGTSVDYLPVAAK